MLFTQWYQPLYFSADIMIHIKAGRCSFWSGDMNETLIVVFFPYIFMDPRELKGSGIMMGLENQVLSLFKSGEWSG